MTIEQAIERFGSVAKLAEALGVTRQTIYNWRRSGDFPQVRQMQAELMLRERGDG
jgi:Bacterial regulatory protein, Fis family.